MSPRVAEPAVRSALIETAARLLAEEGPTALTTRRLANEVGTSTMSVYTHFGGMEDLIRAVVWEGFERLAAQLSAVEPTKDPVADLVRLGAAYRLHAVTDPTLYAVMFGGHGIGEYSPTPEDRAHGLGTFAVLVDGVQRCMDAGRFRPGDATAVAVRLWASVHGTVSLELAGFLADMADVEPAYRELITMIGVGLGDDPRRTKRSVKAALSQSPSLGRT